MPKRVYLQPKDLVPHSKHHTAYAGDGAVHEGKGGPIYKLEFIDGVATNVDEGTYQRFKDLGVAGEKRPERHPEDRDEDR